MTVSVKTAEVVVVDEGPEYSERKGNISKRSETRPVAQFVATDNQSELTDNISKDDDPTDYYANCQSTSEAEYENLPKGKPIWKTRSSQNIEMQVNKRSDCLATAAAVDWRQSDYYSELGKRQSIDVYATIALGTADRPMIEERSQKTRNSLARD